MPEYPHSDLTERVISAAIEVHRHLGPGLLESAYELCLSHELKERSIRHERQVDLPVRYKSVNLDAHYRIDLLIEEAVVIELKSVAEVTPVHEAQLLTYLKLARKPVGLLINFNTELLKNGIIRRVI